ncbi:molybdate ABC transporter substrate-binding protein [Salininema proteolyticum]|uniref:Molybdate ABC transporter substrate-binding protein n=1 Tax=Salininema proteolyticum TaxID=1607685 RepID=A0ABV8TX79_9ACTN
MGEVSIGRRFAAGVGVLALAAAAGCSSHEESVSVFAAASLTEAFQEMGEAFEEREGVAVEFNFAGSSTLAAQIDQGAPADVFASADTENMDKVTAGGHAESPEVFASNSLVIATAAGNPEDIESLEDLARVPVALCAEEVPCGRASQEVLDLAGADVVPETYERDVKATLAKVTLGQVDAALVYLTDAVAAGDGVDYVEFPEAEAAVNEYPVAALVGAADGEAAEKFARFVLSDGGREILAEHGFGAP